jgi:type 2 lantibiotic biosynthesis protein LanM
MSSAPPETVPQTAELIVAAQNLAEEVWARRQVGPDGRPNWVGPRSTGLREPIQTLPIGPYFYSGLAGISYFLAALHRVLAAGEYRTRSLQVLEGVRTQAAEVLDSPPRAQSLKVGIGGVFGLGSLIYTFTRIGQFLDEPALIQEAHRITTLLTPEKIAKDQLLDISVGSAGSILALLALHEIEPAKNSRGASPLDIACDCANHLILRRTSFESRPKAWVTITGYPPLSGFSHGAAGICYALLRLYEKTGIPELLQTAWEGLEFERSIYSPEHENWRDLRFSTPAVPRCLTNWCHGAPGIALGRLGMLHILNDAEIREEIRIALKTTESLPQTKLDHLCCGNMGRVEILSYASEKLNDPRLQRVALNLTGRILRRARQRGLFGWVLEDDPAQFDPSFFLGAAGIGFEMLRLAAPGLLPYPLLLD